MKVILDEMVFVFKKKLTIKDGRKYNVKPFDLINFINANKKNLENSDWLLAHAKEVMDYFLPLLKAIKVDGPDIEDVGPLELFQLLEPGIASLVGSMPIPKKTEGKNE